MMRDRATLSRRRFLTGTLAGFGTLAIDCAVAGTSLPAVAVAPTGARAHSSLRESPLASLNGPAGTRPSSILKLYHIHTTESLEIEYRRGQAVITSALGDIDHLLRDFRSGQESMIDVDVLDTLSLLYDQFGRRGRFEIISGFRSPRTNAALRRVTDGVAEDSFHMEGRAIDVRLVGTRTDRLRDAALALGRGGVGYYPESNFVHIDSGSIRSW